MGLTEDSKSVMAPPDKERKRQGIINESLYYRLLYIYLLTYLLLTNYMIYKGKGW